MRHRTAKFYSSFSKTSSRNRRFCKEVNKAGNKVLSTECVFHSQQVFSHCLLWPEKSEMALALGRLRLEGRTWGQCFICIFYLASIIITPSALLSSFSLGVLLGFVFLSPLPSFSFVIYLDATRASISFFFSLDFPWREGSLKAGPFAGKFRNR